LVADRFGRFARAEMRGDPAGGAGVKKPAPVDACTGIPLSSMTGVQLNFGGR
jgi:hypothetical protein